MKTLLLLMLFAPTIGFAQVDTSKKKMLYEGTVITVELTEGLDSKRADEGDVINFITSEPVIVDNITLIPAGAKVTGKVTDSEKAKGLGKGGSLNFTIDYLYLKGGRTIKLTSDQGKKGKKRTGTAVAQAVVLTPLFLLKRGKNVKFKSGDKFQAMVEKDYEL